MLLFFNRFSSSKTEKRHSQLKTSKYPSRVAKILSKMRMERNFFRNFHSHIRTWSQKHTFQKSSVQSVTDNNVESQTSLNVTDLTHVIICTFSSSRLDAHGMDNGSHRRLSSDLLHASLILSDQQLPRSGGQLLISHSGTQAKAAVATQGVLSSPRITEYEKANPVTRACPKPMLVSQVLTPLWLKQLPQPRPKSWWGGLYFATTRPWQSIGLPHHRSWVLLLTLSHQCKGFAFFRISPISVIFKN